MKLLNETMMSVTPLKHEKWYPHTRDLNLDIIT